MKLVTLFNEILNEQSELDELFGVSFDARIWQPIIVNNIRKNESSRIIKIEGKFYPKEYSIFPIDRINIDIDPRYGGAGGYDQEASGYNKNGEYEVYFVIGPMANSEVINHELRHAYEDFKRISKGGAGFKDNKEATDLFGGDFSKFMTSFSKISYEPFTLMISALYYTSKIERSAYAETVWDESDQIIKYISSVMNLSKYSNIQNEYNSEQLLSTWLRLKEKYHIPVFDRFENPDNFIKWATNEIQYKGRKTLNKLRKVAYFRNQQKKEGDN